MSRAYVTKGAGHHASRFRYNKAIKPLPELKIVKPNSNASEYLPTNEKFTPGFEIQPEEESLPMAKRDPLTPLPPERGTNEIAASNAKYSCDECNAEFDDEDEMEPLYECQDCGERFTKSNSVDGDSHRCPSCNKFGSLITHNGCAVCGQGECSPT